MTTLKELLTRREEIDAEIERIRDRERTGVIEEIRQRMIDYAITAAELTQASSEPESYGSRSRKPARIKYLNPSTGEKWSGRGREPAWIRNVPDRNAFLV
ncbi:MULTISPECIES: H-NS family nucleoid-associated regulatory protein [Burkholderia cepacia complex]|uniref:H-NS histone family protein n=1 Tax=Burkholderia cepacia complex TaxID=87882 RepID=UPI0009B572DC|nr:MULTISPECIES: H-NS histone family protein [Burkholderia cepacia complex]